MLVMRKARWALRKTWNGLVYISNTRQVRWIARNLWECYAVIIAGYAICVVWFTHEHWSRVDITILWAVLIMWVGNTGLWKWQSRKHKRLLDESMQLNEQQRNLIRNVLGR